MGPFSVVYAELRLLSPLLSRESTYVSISADFFYFRMDFLGVRGKETRRSKIQDRTHKNRKMSVSRRAGTAPSGPLLKQRLIQWRQSNHGMKAKAHSQSSHVRWNASFEHYPYVPGDLLVAVLKCGKILLRGGVLGRTQETTILRAKLCTFRPRTHLNG